MKCNIELLVHDWNPNGTNDVTICIDGEASETIGELTFGINIKSYGIEDHGNDFYTATVPMRDVIANLAISPVRTAAQSYQMLMNAINGGAK
jgi:hypothetical protein